MTSQTRTIPVRTAIVYDFDGTLARGNIQEASFLPSLGIEPKAFWEEVKRLTREADADEILVYMNEMLRLAREKGHRVNREFMTEHGRKVPLFEGLANGSWFRRIDDFAQERGLFLEHYIVSSGIREMISGSPIAEHFEQIFASTFLYADDGEARWPAIGINYTTKTQYLFRINKGIANSWDNKAVNAYMPEAERPVPFKRMIFIGDGDTDIPSLKMVTYQGGHGVAVYDPGGHPDHLNKIHTLISDGRADYVAPADYRENQPLDIIVRGIIGRIARDCGYRPRPGADA